MNRSRQLTLNLVASITAFIINMGINLFLTPYITKNIGVEAYGFVSLGTQFINYASLVTIALNSMAGRFITIEIHKENWEAANKYFNSVLLSNVIVAGLMLIPSIFFVTHLDKIVDIPMEILVDVKVLFAFLFANYLVSIVLSSFGVSTFATNKLHLKSMREIEARVLKAVLLIILFLLFEPAVSYLGFTAVVVMLYIAFFDIYYTKKFLPDLKISKAYFEIKAVVELISSGIWNTVIKTGQILLDGVDLLIANIYIGATVMGTLALAKIIPALIINLVGVIAGVFVPDFTILYSKGDIKELLKSIKQSMKILGIIINIPIAILFVFGKEFFMLWVPEQNAIELQILSLITISGLVISGPINSIYGVFTVTNRLRTNALVLLGSGVINIVMVLILLKVTTLGVYAIAGVSTVLAIVRNLMFTAPFGAKYLGLKWDAFFPEIAKSLASFVVLLIIGYGINYVVHINSWITWFVSAILMAMIGLFANIIIILSKNEKANLTFIIARRLTRK